MTIDAQIEALERLSALDQELCTFEGELAREKESVGEKKGRLVELSGRFEGVQGSIDDMERTRSGLLIDLRQMNAQIEQSRDKMARCRTEKESLAVTRELEEIRKLIRDRELEVEKLAAIITQARTDAERNEAERSKLAGDLESIEAPALERCRSLESEIATRQTERDTVAATLPAPIRSRYEMIRKRRGTAVAYTTNGTCSACNITLPPMQFQQMRRVAELSQCPQCVRILYYKPLSASLTPPASETPGSV